MLNRIFKKSSIKQIPRFFFTVNNTNTNNITDIKNQFLQMNSKSTIELKDLYYSINICYHYPAYIPKDFLIKIENTSLTRIMAIDNKYYTILYLIMSNYGQNISNKFWMFMDRRLILDITKLSKEELVIIIESISKKYNKSNKGKVFPYINNMITQLITTKQLVEDDYYSLIYSLIRLYRSMKSQNKHQSYTNIDSNLFEILQSKNENEENKENEENLKSEQSNYNRTIDNMIITQIITRVLTSLKDTDIKIKNKYIKVIYDLYSNEMIKSNEIKNYISIIQKNDLIYFDNEKDILSIYYLILVGYNIFFKDTSPYIEELILKYFYLYDAYRINHLLLLIVNSQFFNIKFKIEIINQFMNDLLSVDKMTGKELSIYINSTLELINSSMINEETIRLLSINDFYNEVIEKVNKQIKFFDLRELHEVLDILQYFSLQNTCIKQNLFYIRLLLIVNDNDFIIQIEKVIKSSNSSIKNTNFIYVQGLILTIYQLNSIISKVNRYKLRVLFIEECNIYLKLIIENKYEKEKLKVKSLIDLINKHID